MDTMDIMNIWWIDSVSIGIRILLDIAEINKINQNVAIIFVISQKNDSLSISIQIFMDTWINR